MTNEMNAIRGAAQDGKDFLVKELKGIAGEQARHAADVTQVYVHKNPWQVLGGAVVLGFFIGFLVSRR